jgi:hypothetical protein
VITHKYHCDQFGKDGSNDDFCYKKEHDNTSEDKNELQHVSGLYETAFIIKVIEDGYTNYQTFNAGIEASAHIKY